MCDPPPFFSGINAFIDVLYSRCTVLPEYDDTLTKTGIHVNFSYEVSSYSGQSVLSDQFDCEHVKLKKFFDVTFRQKK